MMHLEYRRGTAIHGESSLQAWDMESVPHMAGEISWTNADNEVDEPHVIAFVFVYERYRRKGIATELLRRAREIDPLIVHSDVRSWAGDAWARSTGDPLPPLWVDLGDEQRADLWESAQW